MKRISVNIKISETIDGYRLDIDDFTESHFTKFNPQTKSEALDVAIRFLQNLYDTRVI